MHKYQELPFKAGYKREWHYFGLFLDDESRAKLLALVSSMIPEGWRTICEHVTIAYNDGINGNGERLLRNWFEEFEYHLNVTEIGKSDKAFAVKVVFDSGKKIQTTSNFAHITIAVAPDAKPVESNYITEWQEAKDELKSLDLKAEGLLKEKYVKQKKVIFLDIDGVLNSEAYYRNKTAGAIDPECMRRLNNIIKETKAKIVISSSWKLSMSSVYAEFKDAGFNGEIIDATPNYIFDEWRQDKSRGAEIEEWLSKNKVDKYIIIDDRGDFTEEQRQFFIQTDCAIGLTDDDAELAINILNQYE